MDHGSVEFECVWTSWFAIELRFISAELSFASELKSRFGKIQLEWYILVPFLFLFIWSLKIEKLDSCPWSPWKSLGNHDGQHLHQCAAQTNSRNISFGLVKTCVANMEQYPTNGGCRSLITLCCLYRCTSQNLLSLPLYNMQSVS